MSTCSSQDFVVSISEMSGNCPYYVKGDEVSLFQALGNHCKSFVYILYPYLLTYSTGGWFTWMRDKKSVRVACPGDENRVIAKVTHVPSKSSELGSLAISVSSMQGVCPYYQTGETYTICPENVCMKLFCTAIPYAHSLKAHKILCPGPCGPVSIAII